MEAPGPLTFAREKVHPRKKEDKHKKMTGYGDSHGEEVRRGHKEDRGMNGGRHPRDQKGPEHRPRVARGVGRTRDMASEADMRCGPQRQVVEVFELRVGSKSR